MNTQTATPTEHHQRPRGGRSRVVLCLAMILGGVSGAFVTSPGHAANDPLTIVSLTFDDGSASQLAAAGLMDDRGMAGTFYVNSGSVGKAGYATRAQLTQLAEDGHEIGGHTVNHVNLPALPLDEAKRQICLDRANLTAWGFSVRSFAYPFAEATPAVGDLVRDCGYNSGRNVGSLRSRFGCEGCSFAEPVPPIQPYATRSHDVEGAWTLEDFQDAVTNVESSGGGWVQLTFHNFCGTSCGELSIGEEVFTQFLDWLGPRAASNNTVVKTVGDVIGGAVQPVVAVDDPVPTQDESGLNNPGLETVPAGTNMPQCWQAGGYGTNTAVVDTVTPGRTGQIAGRMTVTDFADGDAKLITARDLGTCAPAVTPGRTYVLEGWYTATARTQYDVYLRNTAGGWSYWTSSPFFAASPTYAPATWTTPPVPAGSTGISFGLNLIGNGQLTVDDFTFSAEEPADSTVGLAVGSGLTYGKTNTATVTVAAPAGRPAPTGTVTIKDGARTIASTTLSGGSAAISLATLSPGTRQLTASYAGDIATKPGVSAAKTVIVKKATPTVTIRLSTAYAKVRKTQVKVSVTMTLPGSAIKPAGTVYVRVNGRTVRTATVGAARQGRITVTMPRFTKRGTFKVTVKYGGSSTFYPHYSTPRTVKVS